MKEHQTKAKLNFSYGLIKINTDNSTETVEFLQGSRINCPRCMKSYSNVKNLQEHSQKACKGPPAIVETEPIIVEPLASCWVL